MNYLKLILAALLLLCLAPMPYGYYQFIRLVSMIVFAVMAYQYFEKEKMPLAITFGGLVLLFQPFCKIALGRTLWNVMDVVVAVGLVILWIEENKRRKDES